MQIEKASIELLSLLFHRPDLLLDRLIDQLELNALCHVLHQWGLSEHLAHMVATFRRFVDLIGQEFARFAQLLDLLFVQVHVLLV